MGEIRNKQGKGKCCYIDQITHHYIQVSFPGAGVSAFFMVNVDDFGEAACLIFVSAFGCEYFNVKVLNEDSVSSFKTIVGLCAEAAKDTIIAKENKIFFTFTSNTRPLLFLLWR